MSYNKGDIVKVKDSSKELVITHVAIMYKQRPQKQPHPDVIKECIDSPFIIIDIIDNDDIIAENWFRCKSLLNGRFFDIFCMDIEKDIIALRDLKIKKLMNV